MPFPTRTLIKSGLLAAVVALTVSSQFAFADSESGGFVFGDNSESGGPTQVGAETETGGALNSGASSFTGGPQDTGAESDSGGVYQSEGESMTGGPMNVGAESEATVGDHDWGKYVQYYGR